MNWYDPDGGNGAGATVTAGPRGDDPDAMNGNAVMYDAGSAQILMIGGSPSYSVRATSPRGNARSS